MPSGPREPVLAGPTVDQVHAGPPATLVEHHEEQVVAAGHDVVVVRDVVEPVDEQAGDVADVLLAFQGDADLLRTVDARPSAPTTSDGPQLGRTAGPGVRDGRCRATGHLDVANPAHDRRARRRRGVDQRLARDRMAQVQRPVDLRDHEAHRELGRTITDLTRTHEVWMHLIATRDDLGTFAHVHPEPTGRPGELAVVVTFPTAGTYDFHTEFASRGR